VGRVAISAVLNKGRGRHRIHRKRFDEKEYRVVAVTVTIIEAQEIEEGQD
jgi:hypothetical protein